VHPTCYCYWLANSFSQFLPQDACASVDVLNLFDNLTCIALLDWLVWLHLPYCLQWVLVIAILSTSLSACVVIVLLNCIDLYYCLVLLHCIVYLHIPLSLQWVPVSLFSSPICLLVIVFLLQEERFICIVTCVLPLTLTFIVDTLSAPIIVEGSRLCPHPYKYLLSWGKFGVLPPIVDWLHDDCDVASVALLLFIFSVSKLFSHLLFYLALQLNSYFPSPTYLVFDVACTYLNFKLFLPYPLM